MLIYIYQGPKTGKRGRPKRYDGNVNVDSPDMNGINLSVGFLFYGVKDAA